MKNSKKSSAVSKNNEVKKKWETPELSVLDTNFTAGNEGNPLTTEGVHGNNSGIVGS